MSTLVSMKIDQAAREAKYSAPSMSESAPSYPYGLEVSLDNDSLEKLGIDVSDLEVGGKMTLVAEVEVSSVSSNSAKGGDEIQSARLQITKMCLEDAPAKDAAAALYKD